MGGGVGGISGFGGIQGTGGGRVVSRYESVHHFQMGDDLDVDKRDEL